MVKKTIKIMKQKNPIYTLMEKHEVELSVLKRAACDNIAIHLVGNDIWLDKPIVNDMYSTIQLINAAHANVEGRDGTIVTLIENLTSRVIAQIEDAVVGKKYTLKVNPIKQQRKELIAFINDVVGFNHIRLSVQVNIGIGRFLTGFKENVFIFERNGKTEERRLVDAPLPDLKIMADTLKNVC